LNKLRDRLLAIRNETGSFSSSGSERIAPNTGDTASPSNDEKMETRSSKRAWRISAQSTEKDANFPATTKPTPDAPAPVVPLNSQPKAVPSSRKANRSAALPPRSPPRRSSSRLNPQPSPRTPSRPTTSTTPPPSTSYNTPRQLGDGTWDEQLGVLDRLSKQLSVTATQLSEDSPEKQMAAGMQQRSRRSSAADWQKYQDLAAQLEEARSQLQNLDSSHNEVSFAALLEDN